jgi:hydrogenase maturation factor
VVAASGPSCDPTCITCGDVVVAVEITQLLPRGMAVVATGEGTSEEISVALVSAGVGDTVLVHAGEAIAVMWR